MLKTSEEVAMAEAMDPTVVNGIDNANLTSIDSTDPIKTSVEKIDEKGEVVEEKDAEEVEGEVESTNEDEDKNKDENVVASEDEETEDVKYSEKVQKRISKLTKKMRTAERERNEERKARELLEKQLSEFTFEQKKNAKPRKEDFEDEDEYIEALVDWKTDVKSLETKNTPAATQTPEVKINGDLNSIILDGAEKYSDFKEKVLDDNLVFSPELAELVVDTDNPEDVMYYLASNPDESKRLSSLNEVKAAKEIGRIEAKLSLAEKEKKSKNVIKQQSKAPSPIKPVFASGVLEKDPAKMSAREYRAWREKRK